MKHRLAALVLCLACRHRAPPTTEPSPEAAVSPRVDAPVPRDAPRDDSPAARLSRLADDLTTRMGALRGLAPRGPIARGVMSRDAIVARMRERTRQEYPPGEVELEGELLKRAGLIPESMDYEQTMYALLEEQVLGFYDPDARRLYIADWVPDAMQSVTMAHEITHALQDQHFDIGRYIHHRQGGGDRQTAAMAVIEGDATAAMMDHSLAPLGRRVQDLPDVEGLIANQLQSGDQVRLNAAPRAMRDTLLFPYLAGFALCARQLREGGGYRAIDALLANPPDSTEQVIHPEKLASREPPEEVSLTVPSPLARDFAVGYADVLGELGLRLFLQTVLGDDAARAGAAGWGGDRAMLLVPRASTAPRDGGVSVSREGLAQDALVWVIAMDPAPHAPTDAEATELARGAAAVLARRYVAASPARVTGALAARAVSPGRVSLVAQRGRRVLIADRLPAAQAAAVVSAALR